MIKVKRRVYSPWQENTYIVYDDSGECIVIDPGMISEDENKNFDDTIERLKLKIVRVILTHAHLDHIFGCAFMAKKYGLFPECHADDLFIYNNTENYSLQFGIKLAENPPHLGSFLTDKDKINFGNTSLEIIHVPGHSPGSLLYYSPDAKILLSGDVLFCQGIGRSDLPGGNHSQLINGINEKLMILPDDVKVYPGHGPDTTIGFEKCNNPFLF
ncbi:MAG: MBL fold metallo-hydrolase [Marinilabiliaceae bacterium]|nr:MBL fold metallo-hydrolase [Marinilabiliaceae bacterium]